MCEINLIIETYVDDLHIELQKLWILSLEHDYGY